MLNINDEKGLLVWSLFERGQLFFFLIAQVTIRVLSIKFEKKMFF